MQDRGICTRCIHQYIYISTRVAQRNERAKNNEARFEFRCTDRFVRVVEPTIGSSTKSSLAKLDSRAVFAMLSSKK